MIITIDLILISIGYIFVFIKIFLQFISEVFLLYSNNITLYKTSSYRISCKSGLRNISLLYKSQSLCG